MNWTDLFYNDDTIILFKLILFYFTDKAPSIWDEYFHDKKIIVSNPEAVKLAPRKKYSNFHKGTDVLATDRSCLENRPVRLHIYQINIICAHANSHAQQDNLYVRVLNTWCRYTVFKYILWFSFTLYHPLVLRIRYHNTRNITRL